MKVSLIDDYRENLHVMVRQLLVIKVGQLLEFGIGE
jgi:hypothetical protein